MPTSWEISQLFAQQQQMFAAHNAYAAQVGISNPGLNVGAYGGSPVGGFQAVPGGLPGFGTPPPVYNYGSGGMSSGYGSGNAFAGHAMSAMSGLGTAAGIGLGLGTMFGPLKGLAPLIDPISGFMAGYGGLSARGIMGGLAGAAMPLAIGTAVATGAQAFIHGGQQQQQISSQLGSFNFFNPQSRTGMGFTRQDAQDIGSQIRSLAHVPEMLTSVEELTRLLPRMRSMGMMHGIRDASEFATRFKEAVGTINKMAQYLGTTMEDATRFFEHSRHMGFSDRQTQLQNMLNAQFTSGITGMNMQEVMGMQAAGANQAMGFGATRATGARGVTTLAQRIGMARTAGVLGEDAVLNATGLEGSAGDQAAAVKMQGLMMNLSRSPLGQAIIAGAVKRDANGRLGIDNNIAEAISTGRMSIDEVKERGQRLSDQDKIEFKYRAGELGAQFAEKVDIASVASRILSDRGPEAGKYLLQQLTGGSSQDIDLLSQMGGGGGRGTEMETMFRIQQREQRIAERTDPSRIWKRVKTNIAAYTTGPIEQSGAEFFGYLGKQYDQFIDDLVGRHVVELSKGGAEAFRRAMSGGNDREIREMFEAASGLSRMSSAGGVGRYLNGFGGGYFQSIGLSGVTGRSADQQAGILASQYGVSRDALEAHAGVISAGGKVTAEGRAAQDAMWRIRQSVATSHPGWGDYDEDKKRELTRSGVLGFLSVGAQGLKGQAPGYGASVQRRLATNQMNDADLRKLADDFQAAGKMDEAAVARAAASGLAGAAKDIGIAAMAVTPQDVDQYFVSMGGGIQNLADRDRLLLKASDKMRWAESHLDETSLSGPAKNAIRNNPVVRDVLNKALTGGADTKSKIGKAMAQLDQAEAQRLLKEAGISASLNDVRALQDVWGDVYSKASKDPKVAEAIGSMWDARRTSDWIAGTDHMRTVGAEITSAAVSAKGLGDEMQAKLKALGGDITGLAGSGKDDWNARMNKVRSDMTDLAQAYSKLGDKDREAFALAAGPAGRAIAGMAGEVAGLGESATGADLVSKFGLKPEEAMAALGTGKLGDSARLDARTKSSITSALAGVRASQLIMPGAGASTTGGVDQQLLTTLNNIDKAIAFQTSFLETAITNLPGMSKKQQEAIHKAAANSHATTDGSVSTGNHGS